MSDKRRDQRFESSDELLAYLREHTDDIEKVVIPIQPAVELRDAAGNRVAARRAAGAWLQLCGGDSILLSREDAAMLINDGVLQRMNIKCVLDTLE